MHIIFSEERAHKFGREQRDMYERFGGRKGKGK